MFSTPVGDVIAWMADVKSQGGKTLPELLIDQARKKADNQTRKAPEKLQVPLDEPEGEEPSDEETDVALGSEMDRIESLLD